MAAEYCLNKTYYDSGTETHLYFGVFLLGRDMSPILWAEEFPRLKRLKYAPDREGLDNRKICVIETY